MCTCESIRPGHAVVPFASTTKSHASTSWDDTVPTRLMRSSWIRIESPATNGSRQSPLTMVPMFTIAIFMRAPVDGLAQAVAGHVLDGMAADAVVRPAAVREAAHDHELVRKRRVRHDDRHGVVVR